MSAPSPLPIFTLTQVLDTLRLDRVNAGFFVGTQLDEAGHHIVGGHIAAQALVAASQTVPERFPHSLHAYFLRAGDARLPVDFEVTTLHDGGTFAARRVTARQSGEVLLEVTVSFSAPVDNLTYAQRMPAAPDPESLPPAQQQLSGYAGEDNGWWVRPRPIEMRYIDPPSRIALDATPTPTPAPDAAEIEAPASRTRLWWRTAGTPPTDPILVSAVLVYVTGLTALEPAMIARRTTPIGPGRSALLGQTMWFHRPAALSDWVLSDVSSPSGTGGRGLGTGAMFDRGGDLVCTTTVEGYFGRRAPQPGTATG